MQRKQDTESYIDALEMESSLNPIENRLFRERVQKINELFIKKWGKFIPEQKREDLAVLHKRFLLLNPEEFEEFYSLEADEIELDSDLEQESVLELTQKERIECFFEEMMAQYFASQIKLLPFTSKKVELATELVKQFGDDVFKVFFGLPVDQSRKDQIIHFFADKESDVQEKIYVETEDSELISREHAKYAAGFKSGNGYVICQSMDFSSRLREGKRNFYRLLRLFYWNEKKLTEMINNEYLENNIAHEMSHLYQTDEF